MSQEKTEESSGVLKPRQTSYQFAPSSIQGWNDCPILPRSVSSSSVSNNENEQSKKASSTSRRSRRPMYVSHIDYQNQGNTLSIPKSRHTPNTNSNVNSNSNNYLKTPPRLNSSNISKLPPSKSQISNNLKEDDYKNVQIQIQELIRHSSNLDNEHHTYHSQRVLEASLLDSSTNVIFLHKAFNAWEKSNKNINEETVVNILYDFTNSNSNVSWLLSLKTLMSNIKE